MKKNVIWMLSEIMIVREFKMFCCGFDVYCEVKKKVEEEGRVFELKILVFVVDNELGIQYFLVGVISVDLLVNDDVLISNCGMKLNEVKKLKREVMVKLVVEEVEVFEWKMVEVV